MAQDAVIKNIDDLRIFGKNLKVASGNLTTWFTQLNQQMHRVCDSWQDDNNRAFMEQLEKSRDKINNIAQDMERYSVYINRVCQQLDDYKSYRL